MATRVHYNIRHVSVGRPVPYCHTSQHDEPVTHVASDVTCGTCGMFLESFASSPADGGAMGESRFGLILFVALAFAGAAVYLILR